ncbi:MAG: helix-turn-helix transcriptional regulator [Gemmatimonadota bacterium]|nr:helix-turn-helix transcriptional regulator [Gemmatimonadota bacterium]
MRGDGGRWNQTIPSVGTRLAQVRQQRGLTQAELGTLVDVSKRVITYYENESPQPPGALLVDLAKALRCSLDELMGLKAPMEKTPPKTARLLKRLQQVEALPPADQRAVLKVVDALLATRGRTRAAS